MIRDLLVINAGSSSIKFSIFTAHGAGEPQRSLAGVIEEIGVHPHARVRDSAGVELYVQRWSEGEGPRDPHEAMAFLVAKLAELRPGWRPVAVGHRVVHGGPTYCAPAVVTEPVRAALEQIAPFAPLHMPGNLQGIDAARKAFPDAVQVACFDTAFHQGHPWVADTFALPRALYTAGLRRYGFHGLSYAYITRAMRQLAPRVAAGRMIVAHLGNGASMCAICDGQSLDCTMSLTALDGLCMGTRCGQVDPGVVLYLLEAKQMSAAAVGKLLYSQSGLLGLSEISSDMRDLLASVDPRAQQAVDYFIYRIICAAGALAGALGGLDGIVFTAGIGEHAPTIRARVCEGLKWLGIAFDDQANDKGGPCITKTDSPVSAWVVPTDEERMIALYVQDLI